MAYNLGTVKPWVQRVADYLGAKYGIATIGGYRSTGSVPNSDHPKGLAIDLMCGIPVGQKIVADCLQNWNNYNISYVIHNRRFYGSPTSNTPYTGPSPHTDHVHISFKATAPAAGTIAAGGGGLPGGALGFAPTEGDAPDDGNSSTLEDMWDGITGIYNVLRGIVKLIQFLADPDNWKRIGLAVGGGLALLFGLLSMLKGPKVLDLRKVVPV